MGQAKESKQTTATKQKASELRAFGHALRKHRQAKSLTQEQLSWQTKIDRKFISALERGIKEPGLQTILKVTRALDVPVGVFMSDVAACLEEIVRADAEAPSLTRSKRRVAMDG